MPKYRSFTTTQGRNMTGSRALWRATGMKDEDFSKPIIAVVNSYTQFVPGHIHLNQVSKLINKEIQLLGGVSKEFNTIAIDDGIAMGHSGMLYSLPSREIIADSIEYMANAHCVDAMICISNCDKITPGMLMASLRLNIPAIFVSGGPMEAGKTNLLNKQKVDLVDAIKVGVDPDFSDKKAYEIEKSACPTCGSCSGMFTANSMNCLIEALGLSFPGNGTILATHRDRKKLFLNASRIIVRNAKRYYEYNDKSVLPRSIANQESFRNAMKVDISMGGSTNTILHLLAAANEAKIDFKLSEINKLSKLTPNLCKISPNSKDYHMEDFHRAGGVVGILGELNRAKLINTSTKNVLGMTLKETIEKYDIMVTKNNKILKMFLAGPAGNRTIIPFSQSFRWKELDRDRKKGCIRDLKHAYSNDGGLAVLYGNIAKKGCVVKTAGISQKSLFFAGKAKVYESQEDAVKAILNNLVLPGDVVVIRYEGPKGGPGMQEMLYPTTYLKSMKIDSQCALITDGRFSGGTSGLSIGHISPEAASKGEIALIKNGDIIEIDIVNRTINLKVNDMELSHRKKIEEKRKSKAYTPIASRNRIITDALRFYSFFATSADKGAIRDVSKLK